MNRNKLLAIWCFALLIISISGCSSYKKVVYFQNIDQVSSDNAVVNYEPKIKKDDVLSIIVTGPFKEAVAPYNLTLGDIGASTIASSNPEQSTLNYLVDAEGNINFPTLGKIYVEGMTRRELIAFLTAKLTGPIVDPIVVVYFKNYRITVLGEVKNPGTYTMPSEKTTILQALGMAGDLTILAKRDGIILIREVDGLQKHIKIDLRDASILSSPYFYLSQNDVLYVPPTRARVANSTNMASLWSTIFSAISAVATIFVLVK